MSTRNQNLTTDPTFDKLANILRQLTPGVWFHLLPSNEYNVDIYDNLAIYPEILLPILLESKILRRVGDTDNYKIQRFVLNSFIFLYDFLSVSKYRPSTSNTHIFFIMNNSKLLFNSPKHQLHAIEDGTFKYPFNQFNTYPVLLFGKGLHDREVKNYISLTMDKIEQVLKVHTKYLRTQYRKKDASKRRVFNCKFSFTVGYNTGAKNSNNFPYPHKFKKGKGVHFRKIEDMTYEPYEMVLWFLCRRIIKLIDKKFASGQYVVSFSKIDDPKHFVKKHIDKQDITYQYAMALGNYKGAFLRIYDEHNKVIGDYNYRRRIFKMDGRRPHEVIMEGFKGTRYCVIWFKSTDINMWGEAPMFETPSFVF